MGPKLPAEGIQCSIQWPRLALSTAYALRKVAMAKLSTIQMFSRLLVPRSGRIIDFHILFEYVLLTWYPNKEVCTSRDKQFFEADLKPSCARTWDMYCTKWYNLCDLDVLDHIPVNHGPFKFVTYGEPKAKDHEGQGNKYDGGVVDIRMGDW